MTDFRALCAELLDELVYYTDWSYAEELKDRARAALADEPAVPEGREPASVTGQPSDEAWDALVERAWDKYQTVGYQGERFMYDRDFGNALEFVRQGLARWNNPAPLPPAEGEVEELVQHLHHAAEVDEWDGASPEWCQSMLRAADLLQRLSPPQPVPVSERLPGPSDCAPWPKDSDASAWCWVGTDEDGGWNWEQRSAGCLAMFPDDFTHWLPAHALPLPSGEVEE